MPHVTYSKGTRFENRTAFSTVLESNCRLRLDLACMWLPESSLDGCAWPAPAGPRAGCDPGRSSEHPPCSGASASAAPPPNLRLTGPSSSTCGGQGKTSPCPETRAEPQTVRLTLHCIHLASALIQSSVQPIQIHQMPSNIIHSVIIQYTT